MTFHIPRCAKWPRHEEPPGLRYQPRRGRETLLAVALDARAQSCSELSSASVSSSGKQMMLSALFACREHTS